MNRKRAPKTIMPPPDFAAALKKNKEAQAAFDALSRSHRREYVQWITEAKKPQTRARRIAAAIDMLGERNPKN